VGGLVLAAERRVGIGVELVVLAGGHEMLRDPVPVAVTTNGTTNCFAAVVITRQ
jgi:hypothetical protein